MLTEWELWSCANEAIRQHGRGAEAVAAGRAERLAAVGDDAGAATWRRILDRIVRPREERGPVLH
ncbi:MAG: DUF6961 family protein [Allosphingosinicella sp.]|uniref:DUF6961 family protein n=1 Tax=Allosphingosinicella sp. TaxID=2823234 RepID=UPI003951D9E5